MEEPQAKKPADEQVPSPPSRVYNDPELGTFVFRKDPFLPFELTRIEIEIARELHGLEASVPEWVAAAVRIKVRLRHAIERAPDGFDLERIPSFDALMRLWKAWQAYAASFR